MDTDKALDDLIAAAEPFQANPTFENTAPVMGLLAALKVSRAAWREHEKQNQHHSVQIAPGPTQL